jgi:hypothetical protein
MGFGREYWVVWPGANQPLHKLAAYNNWSASWTGLTCNIIIGLLVTALGVRAYVSGQSELVVLIIMLSVIAAAATYLGVPWWLNQTDDDMALALPARTKFAKFAQLWLEHASALPPGEQRSELSMRWTSMQALYGAVQGIGTDLTAAVRATRVLSEIFSAQAARWYKG